MQFFRFIDSVSCQMNSWIVYIASTPPCIMYVPDKKNLVCTKRNCVNNFPDKRKKQLMNHIATAGRTSLLLKARASSLRRVKLSVRRRFGSHQKINLSCAAVVGATGRKRRE
jgi:hypothetical protein